MGKSTLFVAHGSNHSRNNPGFTALTRDMFGHKSSVFVDINPNCNPTHVMDVTKNQIDFFEKRFDTIFLIFAHYSVMKSRIFWHNVSGWLKPGGVVHTVLPRVMYKRRHDYMYGHAISQYTDLCMVDKRCALRMQKKKFCPALIMRKTTV